MVGKRKLECRTYDEKYGIIKFVEKHPNVTQKDVAALYKMKPQTLNDILKNKENIINMVENSADVRKGGIKRNRTFSLNDVDAALIIWFRQYCNKPELHINTDMLILKAKTFSQMLNHNESISNGWIHRFKKRYGIGKILKAGESGSVDLSVVQEWRDTVLNEVLQKYDAENIYNADETGLFWQMLPERSLGFIGTKYHGSNQPKTRITVLVSTNMSGSDKLPLLIIGKAKKPRAFKNVKQLPVEYHANKKAWMTGEIFKQWIHKLDRKMEMQKRKIVMVVDNCTAHPAVELKNIKLVYLPPNTTSITQPMDGGIIKNLKTYYRKIISTKRLTAAENNLSFQWNILDAILAIKSAWNQVKNQTIKNCFHSVGFINKKESFTNISNGHTLKEKTENEQGIEFCDVWEKLNCFFPNQLPPISSYVDIDLHDDCKEDFKEASETEIVNYVLSKNQAVDDDGDNTDEEFEEKSSASSVPTNSEVYHSLQNILSFALAKGEETFVDKVCEFKENFETFITKLPRKQTSILKFIKKID